MSDTELRLNEKIQQLNKHKLPERDLWQGIEYALDNDAASCEPKTSWNMRFLSSPMPLAACVCMLAVVMYFGFSNSNQQQSILQLATELSEQHEEQKAFLLTSFSEQQATTTNWKQQLSELDEAALAIRKALEQEPDNTVLLNMLKRVHQQQLELIERVHRPNWQLI